MNPAISVIFFTVTAGTGYGLLILLAFARLAGLAPDISPDQVVGFGIVGLLLVSAGLISSTFHLANPKNAWRAFTRVRTSWLSREAVLAVLFYPLSLAWLAVEWTSGNTPLTIVLGLLSAVLALLVLISTAMIYASLKTIRQWHTALTPVNFLLLSLMSGALVMAVLMAMVDLPISTLRPVALLLLVVAAAAKIAYFVWIGKPDGPTINTALGFTQASVRLLDVGHSSDTFHTREFGYELDRLRLLWVRGLAIVLGFVLPFVLLSGWLGESASVLALGALLGYAGVFAERWLFFAEARHVVNLYHGAQQT